MFVKTHLFLTCMLFFLTQSSVAQHDRSQLLRFGENGRFKIAQFTDLHWDEGSGNSEETKALINTILAQEQPDLAVLTGDVITAPPASEGWKSIAGIFEEAGIPWALTLGNHDEEAGFMRKEVFEALEGVPYFMGEVGQDIGGAGNYLLPIHGAKDDEVKALLYFLDTHNRPVAHKYGHYDWVHFDQISWYRQNSRQFTGTNNDIPLPALAFFHIPLLEFAEVIGKETTLGNARERVASANINSGLFASFIEMGDVMGMFVGHDHNNDYIGKLYDIALAFGRTTGINAYGNLDRGARIIELHEGEFQFDTWIRTPKNKEFLYYYPSGISAREEEQMVYHQPVGYIPTKNGLGYSYYEGGRLEKIADIFSNANLVKEGVVDEITLDVAAAVDSFAVVFEGLIEIKERGVYRFYTYSDDGSQLSVAGQVVVDNDGSHSARRREGKIALEKGFHPIKLIYFDDYMGEVLEVGYSSRTVREQVLPKHILFQKTDTR